MTFAEWMDKWGSTASVELHGNGAYVSCYYCRDRAARTELFGLSDYKVTSSCAADSVRMRRVA